MPAKESESWSVDGDGEVCAVLEERPQAPVTSQVQFASLPCREGALGRPSRRPIGKPVPDDLELPMEPPAVVPVSQGSSTPPNTDGVGRDSTVAGWAASRPSVASWSSATTRYSSGEANINLRLGIASSSSARESSRFRRLLPRPKFLSLMATAGAKIRECMQSHLHGEASGEASNPETAGVSRGTSSHARPHKQASRHASPTQFASARPGTSLLAQLHKEASTSQKQVSSAVPTPARAPPKQSRVPLVAIDDTTCVPADLALSLLEQADNRRKEGQHRLVITAKPRLRLRGHEEL